MFQNQWETCCIHIIYKRAHTIHLHSHNLATIHSQKKRNFFFYNLHPHAQHTVTTHTHTRNKIKGEGEGEGGIQHIPLLHLTMLPYICKRKPEVKFIHQLPTHIWTNTIQTHVYAPPPLHTHTHNYHSLPPSTKYVHMFTHTHTHQCGPWRTSRANFFQEPFDIWARHASKGIEAQTGVFHHNWTFDVLCCQSALSSHNLLRGSLVLRQINVLTNYLTK